MPPEANGNGRGPGKPWRLLERDGTFNVARVCRGFPLLRATDLYHSLLRASWRRILAAIAALYMLVNALFATAYVSCGEGALEGTRRHDLAGRFVEAFFFSVQTFSTIGYGRIAPDGLAANVIVTVEALTGLLGLALATGLLFARFSRPTARVLFSNVAIIASHDGEPSFLFRMANERRNQIVDATVSVSLSRNEMTAEGQGFRNFYDLSLERRRSPFFALSWTVVHPIDAKSPLAGATRESLREAEAEILVSLIGTDDTFAQTVHARFSYIADDILWGGTFTDMLSRTVGGLIEMNTDRIHDVIGPARAIDVDPGPK